MAVALALGALHAGLALQAPDNGGGGIPYLDLAESYRRADWASAINGYWSPLYSGCLAVAFLVLRPPASWELPVVHLVNFLAYAGALGAFRYFLRQLLGCHRLRATALADSRRRILPEAIWLALGYGGFVWSSLTMITLRAITPDMIVSGLVYLIAGLLLRIRRGASTVGSFALLGAAAGLAYLAKAAMFPVAFVVLGVGAAAVGERRRAAFLAAIALLAFLAVGGPFLLALSLAKGRPTFGDTGKLNYAWFVNGVRRYVHWQGEPPGSGTPAHPTRRVARDPAVFEFATPVGGTYPPWTDPSYWYEGLEIRFDPQGQVAALRSTMRSYRHMLFPSQGAVVAGAVVLWILGRRGRTWLGDLAAEWVLLVPVAAALGMYALVHVEARFVAAFVVLGWLAIFSSLSLPESPESRRRAFAVGAAMLVVLLAAVAGATIQEARGRDRRASTTRDQLEAARRLASLGIAPGERVAVIGFALDAYWARFAGVRIVADIPYGDDDDFWAADSETQSRALRDLAEAGARVVVAKPERLEALHGDWQRLGGSGYSARLLP